MACFRSDFSHRMKPIPFRICEKKYNVTKSYAGQPIPLISYELSSTSTLTTFYFITVKHLSISISPDIRPGSSSSIY